MKVIDIFVPDAFPDANAVGRATHMMGMGLAAAGVEVRVVARWRSRETGWQAPEEMTTRTCGVFDRTKSKQLTRGPWLASALKFAATCWWRVARGGSDCALFYGASPLFLPAALMCRLLRRPAAFVQYDLYRPTTLDSALKQKSGDLYEFTEKYLARTARMLVLSESQLLIDHMAKQAPGVGVFPNWPPTDSRFFAGGSRQRGREACGVAEGTPLVIYTGAISRLEGVDILITAMKQVVERAPKCVLAIAGSVVGDILPGLPPDYHRMPQELGIEPNVKFLGTVPKETVRDLLAAADALAMPKRDHPGNEAASPIKLGEYLSSGRPVVASKVCGIERWLVDGQSVVLCRPGDADDLARAILQTVEDPGKGNEIGARGRIEGEAHCDYRQWGRAFVRAWETWKQRA